MSAPSETPLTNSEKQKTVSTAQMVVQIKNLETALAESRAECERLRKELGDTIRKDAMMRLNNSYFVEQWGRICTLLGIDKIGISDTITLLEQRITAAESREREAYERAAGVCRDYSNWLKERHCPADQNIVADNLAKQISALADERRNDG